MNKIKNISIDDFPRDVLERSNKTPVLVDFWAEWCAPCRVIAPVLQAVVEALNGQVELVKLEVDEGENMKLAGKYSVRGFPTIILFQDEIELARFSSARSQQWVHEFLNEHLPLS
ncbi:MAG: thioredoxin domain-containing protein [Gammaproteobacteria bacterium]